MININQRIGDSSKLNSIIMEEAIKDVRVAMPAIIDSFNAETQTVECQIVIREKLIDKNTNTTTDTAISKLVDVPIVIPQVGDYSLTVPIKKGDECLIIFTDMCYNSWFSNGELGNQEEVRRHDLSDGIAIIGIKSQPKVIKNYSTDSIQMRNKEGKTFIEIKDNDINIKSAHIINIEGVDDINIKSADNVNIDAAITVDIKATNITAKASNVATINAPTITASGNIIGITGTTTINGNTIINGNLNVNGDINVSGRASVGQLTVAGQDYQTHNHNFSWSGESGSSNTGGVN